MKSRKKSKRILMIRGIQEHIRFSLYILKDAREK